MYNIVLLGTSAATELAIHQALPACIPQRAHTLSHACTLAEQTKASLLLFEMNQPEKQLSQLPHCIPGADVLILAQPLRIDQLVDLSRLSAHWYLPLPLDEFMLKRAVRSLSGDHGYSRSMVSFIGVSESARTIRKLIHLYARTEEPVLITGETGTGKEVVAQLIHHFSAPDQACLALNCSSLSASLAESMLFGHARGSFTGALQDTKGFFESAGGGTLFLDEVADLHSSVQPKLLRALESKQIYRLGDTASIPVSARIIAAAQEDIHAQVAAGTFRRDLYYRLSTLCLSIPPLRRRREDIPLLIRYLLKPYPHITLSSSAVDFLTSYRWPGNVRELINVLTRIRVLYPMGHSLNPISEAQVVHILDNVFGGIS